MSSTPLCLHHELALLVLDDSRGTFGGAMYQYGFAGAILSELLLQGVIGVSDDKEKTVSVLLTEPLGDPIMDEALKTIAGSAKPRSLQHWVAVIAGLKGLRDRIAEQLCQLGIVAKEQGKFLWLFTRQIWPELERSFEDEIRKRMAEAMFSNTQQPDSRTAVLIALAQSCGVLQSNFASVELRQYQARIKEICDGKQLAAGATQAAIAAVQMAMMTATMVSTVAMTAAASN
jgi:golgi phosphoprotein 3